MTPLTPAVAAAHGFEPAGVVAVDDVSMQSDDAAGDRHVDVRKIEVLDDGAQLRSHPVGKGGVIDVCGGPHTEASVPAATCGSLGLKLTPSPPSLQSPDESTKAASLSSNGGHDRRKGDRGQRDDPRLVRAVGKSD